jgi:hypothetical protein
MEMVTLCTGSLERALTEKMYLTMLKARRRRSCVARRRWLLVERCTWRLFQRRWEWRLEPRMVRVGSVAEALGDPTWRRRRSWALKERANERTSNDRSIGVLCCILLTIAPVRYDISKEIRHHAQL